MQYFITSLTLGLIYLISSTSKAQAAPGAAPAGFLWQYSDTLSYTANFSDSKDLGVSGEANGGASIMTLGESITLQTFDESMAPANQAFCVLSSSFTVSLEASAETNLFNMTPVSDDFSGTLALSGFSIGVDGAAGPTSDVLLRSTTPITIGPFDWGAFSDQTSGESVAEITLNQTGAAPTDGSNITFGFTGSLAAFFTSASGTTDGSQFFGSPTLANYEATISTTYDVFDLVMLDPVPEPSTAFMLGIGFSLLIFPRRRS